MNEQTSDRRTFKKMTIPKMLQGNMLAYFLLLLACLLALTDKIRANT